METREMAMLTETHERKTHADYAALEEGAPYQLIDGELVMSPSPTFTHQQVSARLTVALATFVETKELGVVVSAPMDVYLTEADAFQPDVLFISNERKGIIKDRVHGAPDLVMEVLSPSTAYYDLKQKKRVYAATGVTEYWIVDPMEKSVDVLANSGGEFEKASGAYQTGTVSSRLLKGFTVDIEKLFSL